MENTKLTERFPISENGWLIQDFNGIHRLVKLTVNRGFLAVKYTHGFILITLLVQEKCHWNSVEMCRMTLVVLWANFTHRFLLITLLFPKKMSLELSGDV